MSQVGAAVKDVFRVLGTAVVDGLSESLHRRKSRSWKPKSRFEVGPQRYSHKLPPRSAGPTKKYWKETSAQCCISCCGEECESRKNKVTTVLFFSIFVWDQSGSNIKPSAVQPRTDLLASESCPWLPAGGVIHPAVAVMAMRWQSACGVLQHLHRIYASFHFFSAGLNPNREARSDATLPRSMDLEQ